MLFAPTEDDMDVFRHVRLHIGAPTNLEQRLDDSERHHIDLMRMSDSWLVGLHTEPGCIARNGTAS